MLAKNQIKLWILAGLVVANYFAWQAVSAFSENKLHIYFLDVGQGDATLVRTPTHENILIDGGPNDTVIQQLGKILPIWDRTIDLMVLTHPQADHLTGLLSVLERFNVEEILATFDEYDTKTNQEWLNRTSGGKYKINYADAADDYYFGEVIWDTLSPLDARGYTGNDINENSIVARLIYGNYKVLLTGDINFSVENKLSNVYADLSADVLKVAHHGSRYASSLKFLRAVGPEAATISVGKNKYGHPAPETLDRLDQIGASIYRTDLVGTVEVIFDTNSYSVRL